MSSIDFAKSIYFLWNFAYIIQYSYNTIYYSKKIKNLLFPKKKYIKDYEISQDWVLITKNDPNLIIYNNYI